jgi:uncharacterized SAM-binding protein YcdF (DUF218 family)
MPRGRDSRASGGKAGRATGQAEAARVYDAIVVLGAALRRDGSPSAALDRRVRHAARLYVDGWAPRIVLTGGACDGHGESEAAAMAWVARLAGVPDGSIILEPEACSTLENAVYSKRILRRHGWRRVLLVTDGFHMPRARSVFRAQGIEADPAPVPGSGGHPLRLVREAAAIAYYALRGRFRARRR